jgi:mannose-6-phosphate isomerase-like protein (cupin superfamily)
VKHPRRHLAGGLFEWILPIVIYCHIPITTQKDFTAGPHPFHMEKVNIAQEFKMINEYWKPCIAAELNGQHVKLDKLKGEFVWHHHDNGDEMFLVVKGRFRMELRDRNIWLEEGEFLVVPQGMEHRPVADDEAHVLLFEPATTVNTGNLRNERTLEKLDRI